jgi:hypothetical protein
MRKHAATVLLFLLASIGLEVRALAEAEVTLELIPQKDPKKKDIPPEIQATVVGGTAAPPVDKIKLIQEGKKGPIEIAADPNGFKTYVQGDETLGIVVVVEAHGVWIGNAGVVEESDPGFYPGVYKELAAAIDGLSKAGPPGSKAAIVTYGKGAQLSEMGIVDLGNLNGAGMGTPKSLAGTEPTGQTNRDLVAGISEAIPVLNKLGTSRKVLVVFGDGQDTNHDQGLTQLKELGKKLGTEHHIDVYAVYLESTLEGDPNGFKALTKNVLALNGIDGLGSAVSRIVDSINDRYYVRFPGAVIADKTSFEWDEEKHTFLLKADKAEIDVAEDLRLAPKWTPPWMRKKAKFRWWLWFLLLPVALIGLLVVAVKVMGRKAAPPPEPIAVAAPPPVAAPAPAPAGPMKTVMIGIGGDDQGFPIVGWIVPLNGPNQFQTFKLQAGATKIGTGGASHIVINDTFMSTEHAQIVCSPAGFVLVDGGSTNGTQVNERRVDKHELVDNDVFMMGKTNFRFKSIN